MKDKRVYAYCCNCGAGLPGVHPHRLRKNPNRKCKACYRLTVKGFSLNGGYIRLQDRRYQHRVVMEKEIGRPLTRMEVVHHRNEVRTDNDPTNLKLYANPGIHVWEEGHVRRHRK